MHRLHLVSNAHLDPVWLWEWEEGAAEAISTFRTAADLCEACDGFVFNHNEAVLYQWVEEYEPELFERIQRLVKSGKWHIMGGWYLQPDCNMPSGESFVRQILAGRTYFSRKFGVRPTTAINFDPFGHSRGLVQILRKSGYDSYLFCRPAQHDCPLPSDDFTWVGFDGSEVTGHRSSSFYNSGLGKAREKVEQWLEANPDKAVGLVLWGVGNHGGGPSRRDLRDLGQLIRGRKAVAIAHSTPERYFSELRDHGTPLPRHEKDINPWGPGCYTSQVRIKQRHRLLENMLFQTEKMASVAALYGLLPYPRHEFDEAQRDLMFAQFHDILPGSSIQPVEEAGLRLMDHGLEILSRVRARTFFSLASGQPTSKEGEIPILVYNPHPFPVKTIIECEFQIADVNWDESFTVPHVRRGGRPIPTQNEQELSNINLDWRKHAVFYAELAPSQMNRFDCALERLPGRPRPATRPRRKRFDLDNEHLRVRINTETGLIDRFEVDGANLVKPSSFQLLVLDDNDDPWETRYRSFRNVLGPFTLMTREEGTRFSGVRQGLLDSVRVVEDGDVRTVVEAMFHYSDSFAVVQYKVPKHGTEMEVFLRIHWNEKSKMLKLSVPTAFPKSVFLGQVAYGAQELPMDGTEAVAQKWVAVASDKGALTCINNGTYGYDFLDGELRVSLLRSAAYSGHPIHDRPIVPQDRYSPRIDQGERLFTFWFNGGNVRGRLDSIDREALIHNEQPFALSFFPSGKGKKVGAGVVLSDDVVQLAAMKEAQDGKGFILRLFEPTGTPRATTLSLPALGLSLDVRLGPFEIKTFRLEPQTRKFIECDVMEMPV